MKGNKVKRKASRILFYFSKWFFGDYTPAYLLWYGVVEHVELFGSLFTREIVGTVLVGFSTGAVKAGFVLSDEMEGSLLVTESLGE